MNSLVEAFCGWEWLDWCVWIGVVVAGMFDMAVFNISANIRFHFWPHEREFYPVKCAACVPVATDRGVMGHLEYLEDVWAW